MPKRWIWPLVLAGLLVVGALLAVADAAVIRPLLPQPEPIRLLADGRPAVPGPLPRVGFGLGFRDAQLDFGYGSVVATAVVVLMLCLAALVAVPDRVRVAVERLEAPHGLTRAYAAGAAAALLVGALTLLFRYTFLLIGIAPLLWLAAALAVAFGVASLGLYGGRRLVSRLGAAHPLLAALVGILIIVDAALVPYLGWLFGAAAALVGLGLAASSRFGSAQGWSLEALRWNTQNSSAEEA
ncbi:MAG TPA: hypothetical protein VF160_10270 [Candidatus Dormibacteraeota bacterium]